MATVSYVTSLFRSHVLLLLLIVPFHIKVVQCTNDVIGGLQFELPDTKRTCFYEDFEHAGMYLFGYKVRQEQDVKHAISVNAESPSGKLVYSGARLQSDEAQFDVIFPGTYTFCFINLQSTPANTSILTQNPFIFFDLRLIDGGESWKEQKEEEQQRLAKEAEENDIRNAMMNETLNRIYEYGEKVLVYQAVFRKNEAIGSEAAMQLGLHVLWWSLMQAAVIIVTGFGQVLAMKLFFTDRREMTVIAVDMGYTASVPVGQIPVRP